MSPAKLSARTLVGAVESRGGRALLGTFVGSVPGFLLPLVLIARLGAGRPTDIYAYATAVAAFVTSLVSVVLEANLVRVMVPGVHSGREAFRSYLRRIQRQATLAAAAFYGVVAVAASVYLSVGGQWTAHQRSVGLVLLIELLALSALTASTSVQAAALYARGAFFLPTASQAARSLCALVAVALSGRGYFAVEAAAAGLVCGELGRLWLLSRWAARRASEGGGAFGTTDPALARSMIGGVWRTSTPHVLNMLLLALNPLIDRSVAASLRPGAVTILDLGERIYLVPMLVITSSSVLVAGVRWASQGGVAVGESDYRAQAKRVIGIALALGVATALAVAFAAAFLSGTVTSARQVAAVSLILLLGLVPESVGILSARLLTSIGETKVFPAFAIVGIVMNVVGDFLGMKLWGLYGIAAATALVKTATTILFVTYCRRLLKNRTAGSLRATQPTFGLGHGLKVVLPVPIRHGLDAPADRPREFSSTVVALALIAPCVAAAWAVATVPRYAALATVGGVILVVLLRVRRDALPAIALVTFALLPTPYLGISRLFGSFIAPAIVVLGVWEARVFARSAVRHRHVPLSWLLLSVGAAALLVADSLLSSHLARSFAWTVTFMIAVPLAAIATMVSGPGPRILLLRAWTGLAIFLGLFALLEGTFHRNPLARAYVIDGQPLRQTWSVYRIETTLGHPLFNALFFAVTASVMLGLALQRFTLPRAIAGILAAIAVVLTASRSGALAVAVGLGIALAGVAFARTTSVGKRLLVAGSVLIAVVAVSQASVLKQRDTSSEGQNSVAYRLQVVHDAVRLIEHGAVFGSGPATSQFQLADTGSSLTFENSMLQVGVSVGVPGLALIVGLLMAAMGVAFRLRRWEALGAVAAYVVCVSGFNVWDQIPESFALLGFALVAVFTTRTEPAPRIVDVASGDRLAFGAAT